MFLYEFLKDLIDKAQTPAVSKIVLKIPTGKALISDGIYESTNLHGERKYCRTVIIGSEIL